MVCSQVMTELVRGRITEKAMHRHDGEGLAWFAGVLVPEKWRREEKACWSVPLSCRELAPGPRIVSLVVLVSSR